jgi:branched-chain amino acid aminotransferase
MTKQLTLVRTSQSRLSEEIRERSAFGTAFCDHMLFAQYHKGSWCEPRIVPYGPLPLAPSISALHYGQSIFEGFKAHRIRDDGVALFRPRDNFLRLNRSANRLAMPEVPESLFIEGVTELVRVDRDWVPHREGGALYVRPVYFAVDEALVVRPANNYCFVVFTCPVGDYFGEPLRLVVEERYVRAFPGGTGDVKPAGNYAGSLIAACRAQEQGYHNVVWLDGLERRFVEESGLMNIFFVIAGEAITPALSGTILPGVIRDSVLVLLREIGIKTVERPIPIDEIFEAHAKGTLTEAFAVGTAATVAPIERIRYRDKEIQFAVEHQDTVATKVRRRFQAIRTGHEPDTHQWLMRI